MLFLGADNQFHEIHLDDINEIRSNFRTALDGACSNASMQRLCDLLSKLKTADITSDDEVAGQNFRDFFRTISDIIQICIINREIDPQRERIFFDALTVFFPANASFEKYAVAKDINCEFHCICAAMSISSLC